MSKPLNIETIFDYLNDREARPYDRLRTIGRDPLPEVEVTAEVYEHFLNVLPPEYLPGGGFFVIERITDNVVNSFWQRGDRYFHRYLQAGA